MRELVVSGGQSASTCPQEMRLGCAAGSHGVHRIGLGNRSGVGGTQKPHDGSYPSQPTQPPGTPTADASAHGVGAASTASWDASSDASKETAASAIASCPPAPPPPTTDTGLLP